ncbi:zinc-finger domain-containing protein [Aliicoccus persicus]|uniref:Zinc-finger domain-containing protein n=1 Tax=Aliicoccus persicus TaxID=930138 RepID=A0A662Z192_9STAP|nr:zinc-finger domain-containing protein [Aliicoccus persicus]SEV83248.1 Protein of unknown function [Aliicoccus persicus]HJE19678.1 zinc-finger domain-containing protein [Aliicoccus persicus]
MREYAITQINKLEQRYCKNCLIKQTLRREKSKTEAHQFCISECSVGQKIQKYGNQLN